MFRRENKITNRRILFLILVPILLAAILLSAVEKKSDRAGNGSGEATGTEADGTGKADADTAQKEPDSEKQGEDAAQNQAEAGEDEEDVSDALAGTDAAVTVDAYDPVQEISFALKEKAGRQRSMPVQIDASLLGGEAGTKCWAVFLPAEMADHPRIFFTKYKKVSLEPLQEQERLGTGRLGSGDTKSSSPEDSEGKAKTRTYSSGDDAKDLTNGSAFRVHMVSGDGEEYSTDLYVYSCTGTATMYLDTKSGSMAAVDADAAKNTSEEAQFAVYKPDGTKDSSGKCKVRGRGNSTWRMMKKPYNLNMEEKKSVLGIKECKKYCLLANTFDYSNMLDRASSQIALGLGMRDTPEGEFVNLYLNGRYNGLYFLSQRPRTGGSVNIKKLDNKILEANGLITEEEQDEAMQALEDDSGNAEEDEFDPEAEDAGEEGFDDEEEETSAPDENKNTKSGGKTPKKIPLHQEGDKTKKWAYNWPAEPKNNTGGYLLQQYSRYKGGGIWFSTIHRRFRVMSPSYPTVGEVNYLSDYMLAAERAIYSEDGIDPETGKHYTAFLDMPSWEDMFFLEEFFAEWDAERWSFYIIKDRDDPLLYCGPMWDFDHSAGMMIYGTYPETAVSMLLFRDTRHGWLYKLLSHDEFVEELYARWRERFSPALHDYLENRMEKEIAAIESAAYMNNIRRGNDIDFREKAEELTTWLERRLDFLDDYIGTADSKSHASEYCRVLFQFRWGNLSHYVRRGEELGYLPLPEFGETQVKSQIEKNEIIGWLDENGKEIDPKIVIDTDRTFSPLYRQPEPTVTDGTQQ